MIDLESRKSDYKTGRVFSIQPSKIFIFGRFKSDFLVNEFDYQILVSILAKLFG